MLATWVFGKQFGSCGVTNGCLTVNPFYLSIDQSLHWPYRGVFPELVSYGHQSVCTDVNGNGQFTAGNATKVREDAPCFDYATSRPGLQRSPGHPGQKVRAQRFCHKSELLNPCEWKVMLLNNDEQYWCSLEFALSTEPTGDYVWIWNIKSDELILMEDEDRVVEIRANMISHGRPLVERGSLAVDAAGERLALVNLREIPEALVIDRKHKAAEVNPIWDDIVQRSTLIREATWQNHLARLAGFGPRPPVEDEIVAIRELVRVRNSLLYELLIEYKQLLGL